MFWLMHHVLGLRIQLKGEENHRPARVIFASKHQSALETMAFTYLLNDPAIVLKKELMWIPFFGWYFKRLGMIPISRDKTNGSKGLKLMLKACRAAIDNQQPIVIFPEGTRMAPGEAGTYHSGVASIYKNLGIPVVPLALNSGYFWPRQSFLKKPGMVTFEFLEAIPPGLPRHEFMSVLESRLEAASNSLAIRD